jgi:hypothetical protein
MLLKNRKAVKGWMLKAKGEILEKLEQTKDINEEKYHKIVDSATKKYGPLAKVGKKSLNNLSKKQKDIGKILKNIFQIHKTHLFTCKTSVLYGGF